MICPSCQREITDYSRYCYFCGKHQATAVVGVPTRRLHRSVCDRKLGGVCGGIAEYLEIDSTVVRVVWALVTFFSMIVLGCLAYLVAWLIMPELPVIVQQPVATVQTAPESPRT
jgi:phage shock protein C